MATKPCRNCGSTEKYSKEVMVGGTHCHVLLPIGPRLFGKVESMAAVEIQVCGECGLTDWFVPKRLLPEVKVKFSRLLTE
jgi:hypothetical protein